MEQPSPKEQYETQKAQKEAGKKKPLPFKNLLSLGVVLGSVLLLGGIAFLVLNSQEELGRDFSSQMAYEGDKHMPESTEITYQSNPPTSGNHWPVPLQDGVYQTEKPDEAVVHSMEHGRVWISYKPTIPQNIIEQLKELGSGQALIVTPREANDADIALAAWTRSDAFNLNADGTLDEKRIRDFIKRYKNKGPEFIPGHGGGKTYE